MCSSDLGLKPGDKVEMHGLRSSCASPLNGKKAVVKAWLEGKARFRVQLPSGRVANVRPQNLRKKLRVGDCVEVVGLASDAAQAYNGKCGVVGRWLPGKMRFEVHLPGALLCVKPANLMSLDKPAFDLSDAEGSTDEPAFDLSDAESETDSELVPLGAGQTVEIFGLTSRSEEHTSELQSP